MCGGTVVWCCLVRYAGIGFYYITCNSYKIMSLFGVMVFVEKLDDN